jgi:hypothetical protein
MATRRPSATTRHPAYPNDGEVFEWPAILLRNPSLFALAGILMGAVTRRRWIFLSSLAAWLFIQERKHQADG